MTLDSIDGRETLVSTKLLGRNQLVTPVSLTSDWFVFHTALNAVDNDGDTVLHPGAITRDTAGLLRMAGKGTMLDLCVQYVVGEAWGNVTLQLFGFDSGRPLENPSPRFAASYCRPHKLFDAEGNHELMFSDDAASDVRMITAAAENLAFSAVQTVDCRGAAFVLPAVKVAADGVGAANLRLLGRIL